MNYIQAAESANHCQRNWDDRPVPEEIIQELISVAVNMPTKQNQEFYKLVVSTNATYNNFVYLNGYDASEEHVIDMNFEYRHLSNKNTQLRAPLLFQWVMHENEFVNKADKNDIKELMNGIGHLSVGISAGAVSLVANALGLKTGFCVCLDTNNVVEKLKYTYKVDVTGTFLTLGIGYPIADLPHNFCVRPDGSMTMQNIYKKNIDVFRLS